jgi:hypothetical protein
LGSVALSLDQTFQHSSLSFTGTTDTLRNVTTNGINSLWFGSNQIPLKISQTLQTGLLANTTFEQQQLTIDSSWSSYGQTKINLKYPGYSIPHMIVAEPGLFYTYTANPATAIAWLTASGWALQTNVGGLNVTCGGTFTQSSDARLKKDVQDLSLDSCQKVFDSISVKSYVRKDMETDRRRCGFIAQEVQTALEDVPDMQNLVSPFTHGTGEDKQEMLGLDYARLASTVLWNVVKLQQKALQELTQRIIALETTSSEAV